MNFVFSSKMLNFAISSVFRPKRISCVPIHQTGTSAPNRVDIGTPEQRPCRKSALEPWANEAGWAAGWYGRTSTTRISAWRLRSLPTEVVARGMQERLSESRYQSPAEIVQARLPLTVERVSTQIGRYFVGGVEYWSRMTVFATCDLIDVSESK